MKQPCFALNSPDFWHEEKELLVLGFFEGLGEFCFSPAGEMLLRVYNQFPSFKNDFKGKFGQKMLLRLPERDFALRQILFVGLGEREEFDLERHRELSAQITCYIRDLGIKSFGLEVFKDPADAERVKATVEEIGLSLYQFRAYKKTPEDSEDIEKINLLVEQTKETKKAFNQGKVLLENVCLTRDLVNEPANVMTPRELSMRAREIAHNSQEKITVEIFNKEELASLGMKLVLAVGQGSQNEPCLIKMEYKPRRMRNPKAPYVLVGKAVCFDSGGLDIKSADSMNDMKGDMAGGAAVICTLKTIAELNLPFWVVGLIPVVENLPSGTSYKPGDIIKAYNGKTIEIGNTDAEGRLILFDTMAYAKEKYHPLLVVDIATLTGACMIALGYHFAGIMGNHPEFIERFKSAGDESGERVWELPLDKKFLKDMESKIADLNNAGPRWGGAINAACFLQEAVGKDQPWIHIDCAGPAYLGRGGSSYRPGGATGFGVRLLTQFFLNQLKGKKQKVK